MLLVGDDFDFDDMNHISKQGQHLPVPITNFNNIDQLVLLANQKCLNDKFKI
jgi:hypothetical protein